MGFMLLEPKKRQATEERCRQVLALRRRLVEEGGGPHYQAELATSHDHLGQILGAAGRVEEAEGSFRQAVAILRRLVEAAPEEPDLRCRLGGVLHNLAGVARRLRHLSEARQL